MGRMIEQAALSKGHTIVARVNSPDWDPEALKQADAIIEFTAPGSAYENIRKLVKLKKPLVIGTTGWYERLESVRALVAEEGIGLLYGSNFSLGVHLYRQILGRAGEIMNRFAAYQVAGVDYHHQEKRDTPSGTALEIAKTLKEHMPRLQEVPFSSVRCGSIPGTHTVFFDSPCDTITITHAARSREGFAEGALLAAAWLLPKKGLYTFSDCIQDLMGEK